jgi:hypothetical protein
MKGNKVKAARPRAGRTHTVVQHLETIERWLRRSRRREIAMAGEIERLQAATAALQASVDAAIGVINAGKGLPAQVAAEAAKVEAETAKLDAAVTP